MTLPRLLDTYRLFFIGFIIIASLQTVIDGHLHPEQGGLHMAVLGSVEVIAAALMLFRRTRKIAAAALIVIFALALALSAANGDWPLRMVFYAGTAIFVVLLDRHR
jgi:uncharacterized membrane protein (UPF0136 family)